MEEEEERRFGGRAGVRYPGVIVMQKLVFNRRRIVSSLLPTVFDLCPISKFTLGWFRSFSFNFSFGSLHDNPHAGFGFDF